MENILNTFIKALLQRSECGQQRGPCVAISLWNGPLSRELWWNVPWLWSRGNSSGLDTRGQCRTAGVLWRARTGSNRRVWEPSQSICSYLSLFTKTHLRMTSSTWKIIKVNSIGEWNAPGLRRSRLCLVFFIFMGTGYSLAIKCCVTALYATRCAKTTTTSVKCVYI